MCARCHRVTLTGYALCTSCERKIRATFETDWESARSPAQWAAGFGASAIKVLTSARTFYAKMPAQGGWVRPAVFGVLAYGIGMCAQFGWSWLFLPEFGELIVEHSAATQLSPGHATALLFVAVPFAAPLVFALHALLLGISLRLFGAQAPWRTVVRIAGYAGAAHLLQLIPPIGQFPLGYVLAIVVLVNLELIGVRRFFEPLGIWRSIAAVFLPFAALSFLSV